MSRGFRKVLLIILPSILIILFLVFLITRPQKFDITFFVVSDLHYGLSPTVRTANQQTIEVMNNLPCASWPGDLKSGRVGLPMGVIILGDILSDGESPEAASFWDDFTADYGLSGERLLKFPCYETFGNHAAMRTVLSGRESGNAIN